MQKEKIKVIVKEAGYLGGPYLGGRVGYNEFMYCTDTRDPKALKEEVLRYLREAFGIDPEHFEITIRDARH